MRLHGFCTECRKPKLVRSSAHAIAKSAWKGVSEEFDQCQQEADERKRADYQRRRRR